MSYPKKLFLRALMTVVAILGLIFLVILFSAYLSLRDVTKIGIVFTFLVGFLYYPLSEKAVDWLDSLIGPFIEKSLKTAKRAKRGMDGEDMVSGWLEEIVGKGNFVSNVELPGAKFDFDAIIVGERGVIVLEVKNLSDSIRFDSEDYYQLKEGEPILISPDKDPRFKLRERVVYDLRRYLDSNGFGAVTTHKALVICNGQVTWNGPAETYIIKDKEHLRKYIESRNIDPSCTPQVQTEILNLLRKKS